ncbi:hypothetical protein Tco_1347885, partial [Tanacetum coccineum]
MIVFGLLSFLLYKSQSLSLSWVELVVRVQSNPSNPSLPLASLHHLTIEGLRVFVNCQVGMVCRVGVEWGKVRDSCRVVLGRWFGSENSGKWWYKVGGKVVM